MTYQPTGLPPDYQRPDFGTTTPERGLASLKEILGGVVQGFQEGDGPWQVRVPNDAELPTHSSLFHGGRVVGHAEHEAAHAAGLDARTSVNHVHVEAPR